MRQSNLCLRIVCALSLSVSVAVISGCSYSQEASVRSNFFEYHRVAIVPRLTRETEDLFLPLYMNHFPEHEVVERRDLEAAIGEQDLLPERMDAQTRAKIRRLFGVEVIVFPTYHPGAPNSVAIKAIDTETGVLAASVIARGTDHWAGEGADVENLIRQAVQALASRGGGKK